MISQNLMPFGLWKIMSREILPRKISSLHAWYTSEIRQKSESSQPEHWRSFGLTGKYFEDQVRFTVR